MQRNHRLIACFAGVVFVAASHVNAQGVLWMTQGSHSSDRFGRYLASGEDYDGDGVLDVVVGSPSSDVPVFNTGVVRVLSGVDGSLLFEVSGSPFTGSLGSSVTALPDLNIDGVPELGLGAKFDRVVLSGADQSLLFNSPGAASVLVAPRRAICAFPDKNDDDIPEVVIGNGLQQTVSVRSGRNGSVLHTAPIHVAGFFGETVATIDDVDGDGLEDLLIAAPRASNPATPGQEQGAVAVVSGADWSLIRIDYGPNTFAMFGQVLVPTPDLTGDGLGDYLVGSSVDNTTSIQGGAVHLVSGGTGAIVWSEYASSPVARFGFSLCLVENFDGTGHLDVAIGAFHHLGGGSVFLHRAATGESVGVIPPPVGITFGSFGSGVANVGDVTGDGRDELAISQATYGRGRVYLYGDCPLSSVEYCTSLPNSTSANGTITACGHGQTLTLQAAGLPVEQFGFFLMAQSADVSPVFEGILCLGEPIVRLSVGAGAVLNSGPQGQIWRTLDLTTLPQNTIVLPGDTWRFQLWHRDVVPGIGSTSNFTNAVAVRF